MQLKDPLSVKRIAVLGAGTIGASWAAHFLGQGMQVQSWDPAPGGEQRARAFIDHFGSNIEGWWADMRDVSLTPEVRAQLAEKARQAFGDRDITDIAAERDTLLLDMMETLARTRRSKG